MIAVKSVGRIVGILTLTQLVLGILANFVLTTPLFGAGDFLVDAAAHAQRIGLSMLLGLAASMISVAIAILAFQIFSRFAPILALWLVAFAVAGFAVSAAEQVSVMSMLSLSEAYTQASTAEQGHFQALRGVVASTRNWSHYTSLVAGGCMILVFYLTLFRSRLIPRALAAFGVAAALLQIAAVAMPLLGYEIVLLMIAPLALSQLLLSGWLIAMGFRIFDAQAHAISKA